ncbi:MAG: hypothetical protein M5U18_09295 [Dehalococcoidia bacterium]|nr:hypothetical protein [Dehalococcoidia bacterium]
MKFTPNTQSQSRSGASPHRQPRTTHHPRVVAQDVDIPEGRKRGVGELLDVALLQHVGAHSERLRALRPDGRLGHRQRLALDVGEHHLHALIGKTVGKGQAHPARRAGHDGNPPCQVFHPFKSSVSNCGRGLYTTARLVRSGETLQLGT